jgi:hypothetical protein
MSMMRTISMTILITDRTTGETHEAHSVDDCHDFGDILGFRFAEAYGREVLYNTVYEVIHVS